MICFTLDILSPCLINVKTGATAETEVITLKNKSVLSGYNKKTGWYINWANFDRDTLIKAIVLKGSSVIQGLIAMKADPVAKAVHILWACASPNNNVWKYGKKEYSGVGGHLFAIAGKYSVSLGYDGFVFGEAMDSEIMNYYIREFGAEPFPFGYPSHPYRIIVPEASMKMIMEEYTYEEIE